MGNFVTCRKEHMKRSHIGVVVTAAVVLAAGSFGTAAEGVAPAAPADAAVAAANLARRVLKDRADAFAFETIPADAGRDVFEVESAGGKVVVRGNSGVSMAVGLNWYLRHRCRCNVSLCGSNVNLPRELPEVRPAVRKTAWAKQRYFLNYCCFGYSLPWYDWDQWQQLIDWMALSGVNMPLSVTGQEAVWEAVCRRLGMSDEEISGFLAGPPYLPFQWMGCLDGWGGPLPKTWNARHEALGRQILARQRELGMTPVLQGFTGHVPAALVKKFPDSKFHTIRWIEWQTHLLDPLDPLFAKVAAMWMREQRERFGASRFYAADTFIEMTPPSGDLKYLGDLGRAIYGGMSASDPQAVWVLQTWIFLNQRAYWTQPRIEAFLGSVANERMICLDLSCENRPQWSRTRAFCGKPWLWCNIQNYGNVVGLGGGLRKIAADLFAARKDPNAAALAGLGFVNEGLDYNPVVFDLMYEMAWMDAPPDVDEWIADYAACRYGRDDPDAQAAWKLLLDAAYDGPHRGRPAANSAPTVRRAHGAGRYDNRKLADAWGRLLAAAEKLPRTDALDFDVVNVGRQVLVSHADAAQADIVRAFAARDANAFAAAGERFLRLIDDTDRLVATRPEFLLGRWIADARRWGDTQPERDRLEWNARRVLTLWGEGPAIDDYANKDWSGLLGGYYRTRWQMQLDQAAAELKSGRETDEPAFQKRLRQWMADWSAGRQSFPSEPTGDPVPTARQMYQRYCKQSSGADGGK